MVVLLHLTHIDFGVSVILISPDTCNNLQGLVQMTKRIVSI